MLMKVIIKGSLAATKAAQDEIDKASISSSLDIPCWDCRAAHAT